MNQGNLGEQFEEIGKSFKDVKENIPHIKLEGNEYPRDPFVNKWRRRLLIGLSILVIAGAGFLIITKLLGRFF